MINSIKPINLSIIYAKSSDNKITNIIDVQEGTKYFCLDCSEQIIPKQSNTKKWHFAHINGCNKNCKLNNTKQHIINNIQNIKITTYCNKCKCDHQYQFNEHYGLENVQINDYKVDIGIFDKNHILIGGIDIYDDTISYPSKYIGLEKQKKIFIELFVDDIIKMTKSKNPYEIESLPKLVCQNK